jgi:hypothetical protein
LYNGTDAGVVCNWGLNQLSDDEELYVNYISEYPYNLTTAIDDSGKNGIEFFGNTTTAPTFFLAPNTAYPGKMFNIIGESIDTKTTGWYIHDLIFDGNSANQGTAGHITVWTQYANNCTFRPITVQNTAIGGGTDRGKAFDTYNCTDILIDQSTVNMIIPDEGVTGKNDVAYTGCYNVTIQNTNIIGGSGGINFFEGTHLGVARNNVLTNQTMGGLVSYVNSYDNIFENNTVTGLPDEYAFTRWLHQQ